MPSTKTKEPQHHNTDVKVSNSTKLDLVKQATCTFALAKHISACHPLPSAKLDNELSQLISQYDSCEKLPSLALANQLDSYIQHASEFLGEDDKNYIASCVERYHRGIPIHIGRLMRCQKRVEQFKACHDELLISGVIYYNSERQIQAENITDFLSPAEWLEWPKNDDGSLCLEAENLKGSSIPLAKKLYRAISFFWYRSLLRFNVDHRGIHYDYPNPFAASSGREAPKGNSFMYISKDIRHYLLKPKSGKKIITLDWCSQEPASLAALANDTELWSAYQNGDLYTELRNRSKLFSNLDRQKFKVLCISHLYGCTSHGIKKKFRVSSTVATAWQQELRLMFSKVNDYLDNKVAKARAQGYAEVHGFRRTVTAATKSSSIRNFYVQAVCARMLRMLCLKLDQLQIPLLFAIHDSISFEADIDDMDTESIASTAMASISESILGSGYQLLSEREHEVSTPINN